MTIRFNDDFPSARPKPPLLLGLMTINVLFVALVLGAWTYVSMYLVEPFSWATWVRVYRSDALTDIFAYPYIVLWAMPLCFVTLAWLSDRCGARGFAWLCATMPVALHGIVLGWFHLAPLEWR